MGYIFRLVEARRENEITKRKRTPPGRALGMNHDDGSTLYIAHAVVVTWSHRSPSVALAAVVADELPIPRTHLNLCSPRPTDRNRVESSRPTRAALSRDRERDPSQGCSKSAGAA